MHVYSPLLIFCFCFYLFVFRPIVAYDLCKRMVGDELKLLSIVAKMKKRHYYSYSLLYTGVSCIKNVSLARPYTSISLSCIDCNKFSYRPHFFSLCFFFFFAVGKVCCLVVAII